MHARSVSYSNSESEKVRLEFYSIRRVQFQQTVRFVANEIIVKIVRELIAQFVIDARTISSLIVLPFLSTGVVSARSNNSFADCSFPRADSNSVCANIAEKHSRLSRIAVLTLRCASFVLPSIASITASEPIDSAKL